MESKPAARILAISTISGLAAYLALMKSGYLSALVVLFTTTYLLFRFSSGKRAWNTLAKMKNPFWMAILGFLIGFSSSTFQDAAFGTASFTGLGVSLLFGVFSMLLAKYWA